MNWRVFQGSARGSHHIDNDIPCQDYAYQQSQGDLLCAIVCDGAGSADYSEQGATFFAQGITRHLLDSAPQGPFDIESLKSLIAGCIETTRSELLLTLPQEHTLRDYAATVVGCLIGPQGGCFFHIGDGFAVFQEPQQSAILSLPENGEYASETYFVTGEDWQDHLRVTLLPAPCTGTYWGLMSDGAATFAIDKQRTGFFPAFINPVLDYLHKVDETTGNAALINLLESPKTTAITSDDKTLLLACFS